MATSAQSMILQMLKTPQQVREEQQKRLTEQAMGMQAQVPRGTTALPGILTNFANQALVRQQQSMAEMPRRLAGAAGMIAQARGATPETARQIASLGLTGQELQAQATQEAMRGLQMGNIESMKQALKRMQEANAPLEAQIAMSEKIAQREKEILDRASAARGEQLQRDLFGLKEREIELEEAKFEAEQALGGVLGEFNLDTEDGVNDAVAELMKRGKLGEAIRLKNAFKKEKSRQEEAIQFFADKYTNGDMEAAFDMYLRSKGTAGMDQLKYKRLNTEYDKALASKNQLVITNAALRDLDQTDPILGAFAKTRAGVNKFVGQIFGIDDMKEAATQTEALLAKVRNMSAEKLGSGIFGSGTGISEKDMEEAKAIAGASENLTPEGMAFILRFNARLERAKLMRYNERLQAKDPSFWSRLEEPIDSYLVQAPELYMTPVSEANAEKVYENPETGEIILLFQNRWYNPDGTFYARAQEEVAQ